jgi:hypothetical protein
MLADAKADVIGIYRDAARLCRSHSEANFLNCFPLEK